MTAIDQIRSSAFTLPKVEERDDGARTSFVVADRAFAIVEGDTLRVRADADNEQAALLEGDGDDGRGGWIVMRLADDTDPQLVEDRIARAWELIAPAGLLEAGGR